MRLRKRPKVEKREFKTLQRQWYKKLKESGFNDLEIDNKFIFSGQYAGKLAFVYDENPLAWESKEEYFRQACAYVLKHKFTKPVEKAIFKLHSEGAEKPEIVQALRPKYPKLTYAQVRRFIDLNVDRMLNGPARSRPFSEHLSALLGKKQIMCDAVKLEVNELLKFEGKPDDIYKKVRVCTKLIRSTVMALKKVNKGIRKTRAKLEKAGW
jgi:hypothetical protein